MKKLVENIANFKLIENAVAEENNDSSDLTIQAIVAHSNVKNSNGFTLVDDALVFNREFYPFLFNHTDTDLLGKTKTHFDNKLNAYVSDISVYGDRQEIIRAINEGVYDSVSISYYLDEYSFDEDDDIIVTKATMKEISLVSVGADDEAKLISNELEQEKKAHVLAKNRLKEIKKNYE
ncbi:hypothetical protein GHI93_12060 [Lactococcus hircilactis]|uniref:Prohead serine protease domain-containing protein n=1 Tax=Lactococcus hircilactis TaxID=1494462 RepID=A0A7X1ZA42_9LACT|nr:HK97 family phage prohead protease [Lactococcus hircilactis]MQW40649.1 hypothetical protein [Lactococcus hircilactis]